MAKPFATFAAIWLSLGVFAAVPAAAQNPPVTIANIPSIPNGVSKQFRIHYRARINPNISDSVMNVSSQATVTGSNFSPVGPVTANQFILVLGFVFQTPTHFLWNGFLNMQNIVGIVNRESTPVLISTEMFDSNGNSLSTQNFTIPGNGEFDLPVNALPGFSSQAIGSLRITTQSMVDRIDANGMFYRFAPLSSALEFMTGGSLGPNLAGPSAVGFNTIQPSRRASQATNAVENWLSITNLDNVFTEDFILDYFDQTGAPFRTVAVSIPPFGRRDIASGHDDPGPRKVGLVRINPSNPETQYNAVLTRYGASGPSAALSKFYHFATSAPAQRADQASLLYVPISRGANADNWVMVANTGTGPGTYKLTFRPNDGSPVTTSVLNLAANAQVHVFANSALAAHESGVLEIEPSGASPYIVESSFYFFDPSNGETTAAYTTLARRPLANNPVSAYNTFLGQANFLKLYNIGPTRTDATLTAFGADGSTAASFATGFATFTGADIAVQAAPISLPPDTYGLIGVTPSQPGSLIGDELRLQLSPNGTRVEGIQAIELR